MNDDLQQAAFLSIFILPRHIRENADLRTLEIVRPPSCAGGNRGFEAISFIACYGGVATKMDLLNLEETALDGSP